VGAEACLCEGNEIAMLIRQGVGCEFGGPLWFCKEWVEELSEEEVRVASACGGTYNSRENPVARG
jgi:hypothetical protein